VAISIETLPDLNSMLIEEATNHLCAVEERKKKSSSGSKEGRLLLIKEEWMTCLKIQEGESSNGGHGGRGRDRGRRDGDRESSNDSQEESACRTKSTDVCRTCAKHGHWDKECMSKARKSAQAHVAEEEEGGLLLVEASEIQNFLISPVTKPLPVTPPEW
jgi:hypothetical protein